MKQLFSTRIRKSNSYRRSSRLIKRILNIDSIFSSRPKYPELHRSIESFPLEDVRLNVDRSRLRLVAVVEDEGVKKNFYSDRFIHVLQRNNIPYKIVDLRSRSFVKSLSGCDALIFRPNPRPFRLEPLRDQIHFIEARLGIPSFPSFRDIMLYENKRLQYWFLESLELPVIPTFVSASRDEMIQFVEENEPPYVFKANAGAGATGVELVGTKAKGKKYCARIFSPNGSSGPWPYMRQKDTVLIQRFVENRGFDLRICVVGDRVFGYFRKAVGTDFRASGSGVLEFGHLPDVAVRIAIDLRRRLDCIFVAVDFIQDIKGNFLIVEFSTYIGHTTSGLYRENGAPGWLRFNGSSMISELGYRCWFPDLMVKEFLERSFPPPI